MLKPLNSREKQAIVARLRTGESAGNIADDFRVPRLWICRIENSIRRMDQLQEGRRQRQSRIQSLAMRGAKTAKRPAIISRNLAPDMKTLIASLRAKFIKIGKVE